MGRILKWEQYVKYMHESLQPRDLEGYRAAKGEPSISKLAIFKPGLDYCNFYF